MYPHKCNLHWCIYIYIFLSHSCRPLSNIYISRKHTRVLLMQTYVHTVYVCIFAKIDWKFHCKSIFVRTYKPIHTFPRTTERFIKRYIHMHTWKKFILLKEIYIYFWRVQNLRIRTDEYIRPRAWYSLHLDVHIRDWHRNTSNFLAYVRQLYLDICIRLLQGRNLRSVRCLRFRRAGKVVESLPTCRDQRRKRARTLVAVEERFATGGTVCWW